MKKTNRTYEFAKMYYDWVCNCLTKDGKDEELTFFMLGVDLAVRQKELINIEYSQINFPYVENIKVMKVSKIPKEPTKDDDRDYKYVIDNSSYYPPREIRHETYDYIKCFCNKEGKLFTKSSQDYIASIVESIGDGTFNGHMFRRLGTLLRFGGEEINR